MSVTIRRLPRTKRAGFPVSILSFDHSPNVVVPILHDVQESYFAQEALDQDELLSIEQRMRGAA